MPAELETVRRDAPVSTLVALTVAPGTAAPPASVTLPVSCPAPTCARRGLVATASRHTTATRTRIGRIRPATQAQHSISSVDVMQIDLNRFIAYHSLSDMGLVGRAGIVAVLATGMLAVAADSGRTQRGQRPQPNMTRVAPLAALCPKDAVTPVTLTRFVVKKTKFSALVSQSAALRKIAV